jgi:hypothetical protein
MNVLRPLVLIALAAALAVPAGTAGATTPPAHPDTATTTDAVGDVTSVRTVGDVIVSSPAPKHANGDIKTVKVTHTATSVRILTRFVDLGRIGSEHVHYYRIKTPTRSYEVGLIAKPGAWRGKATLRRSGKAAACAMSWKIDYDLNSVLLVVPRRCVGTPTWIRAGAGTFTVYGDTQYEDDGRSSTPTQGALVLGPRLYS